RRSVQGAQPIHVATAFNVQPSETRSSAWPRLAAVSDWGRPVRGMEGSAAGEGRGQKAERRRQKAGGRGEKGEGRRQRARSRRGKRNGGRESGIGGRQSKPGASALRLIRSAGTRWRSAAWLCFETVSNRADAFDIREAYGRSGSICKRILSAGG